VDILFAVDIAINFRTAYYDEDYEMVLDVVKIRGQYMQFWFWIDLLAVFPFEYLLLLVSVISGNSNDDSFTGVTGLFKLPRLFRMARFLKKLDVVAAANAFRIVALLVGFVLVAHWFACM
jgi:hypothetical protein